MKEIFQDILRNRKRLILTIIFGPALLSLLAGCMVSLVGPGEFLSTSMIFMLLAYPAFLFIFNIIALVYTIKVPDKVLPGTFESKLFGIMDLVTVLLGAALSFFYGLLLEVSGIQWDALWSEQLHNSEIHQPIWSGALPTVITLFVIGIIGYIVLLTRKMAKTPPLITVLCMGAMYIGASQLILFVIQIFKVTKFQGMAFVSHSYPLFETAPLMVLPFCCISMAARLIIRKIYEWNINEEHNEEHYAGEGLIGRLNEVLSNALSWPVAAIIAMLPLLGVILGILSLFGQYPDHMIRAWTETAQWNLSRMEAPPNVIYDEHYLCTVAAGGHEEIVKPIRMGERHGHRIVVNRQLLIANAFEQVLEEKTPRIHRAIRNFYDKHGYPVAGHIKTKAAADIVYFIMKPLEILFLLVLYLVDAKPENRIAVQYLPKESRNRGTTQQ
ncbi:MAG: hypothetical protein K6E53_05730 [Lachnospiraceae bacterium]|nr:hypothetical protein [Lachnospiraceae bacterium]